MRAPWLTAPRLLLMAACALVVLRCSSARYGDGKSPTPGLVFPARLAETEVEADGGDAAVAPSTDAAGPPRSGYLPDPQALRLARQWEYELVYERGKVRVVSVTERRFAQPVATARRIGRYAIELWIGKELIERVRFDFPLLAAEPPPRGRRRPLKEPPSFAAGAVVSQRVRVPASPRARRAILLDRATGWFRVLPWPPDEAEPPPGSAPSVEAGVPARPAAETGAAGAGSEAAPDAG